MQIGILNTLEVGKEVDFGVYLNSEWGEILLPTKYIPEGLEVGDEIEVFLYRDSEDRLIATTLTPLAFLDEFAALTVKDIAPHGAYMEWGLEKDLLVPNKEQNEKFEVGNTHVVRVCIDHQTHRLIGTNKIGVFFEKENIELQEGQHVDLLIHRETELGYLAVVDQKYEGLIYDNEIFDALEIGDKRPGWIKKVREDGKIDLTIYKTGLEAMDENKEIVLTLLKQNDGFMPFHDKSNADDITYAFTMSKKSFKKAIGGLYKDKIIDIDNEKGITLL